MQRAIAHFNAAGWPSEQATDGVTLAFDERHRRRIRLRTDKGEEILLDLPKAKAMAHGDGLRTSDGSWLAVRAAPEPLLEIRCATPVALQRMAWHLGNRHLPTDIAADRLRIRPDHVVEAITAPFQPEGGAYDEQGGGHSHEHGH
jgi:urease accessory protein